MWGQIISGALEPGGDLMQVMPLEEGHQLGTHDALLMGEVLGRVG